MNWLLLSVMVCVTPMQGVKKCEETEWERPMVHETYKDCHRTAIQVGRGIAIRIGKKGQEYETVGMCKRAGEEDFSA